MIVNLRCLYIVKKNPIVTIETLEEVFGICDFNNPDAIEAGYLYPMDAFDLIAEAGWKLASSPAENDLGKPVLGYAFIKKEN